MKLHIGSKTFWVRQPDGGFKKVSRRAMTRLRLKDLSKTYYTKGVDGRPKKVVRLKVLVSR